VVDPKKRENNKKRTASAAKGKRKEGSIVKRGAGKKKGERLSKSAPGARKPQKGQATMAKKKGGGVSEKRLETNEWTKGGNRDSGTRGKKKMTQSERKTGAKKRIGPESKRRRLLRSRENKEGRKKDIYLRSWWSR